MNILVSNHNLDRIGGSETFTYTIIEELKRLGHQVEYFSFNKGFVSQKIENDLGVFYMSQNKYDLIFANHNTTVTKLYKKGFTIQTCHGIYPKLEQPSAMADAYVSISEEVQNHLALFDYPSLLIRNSINLKRFKPENKPQKRLNNILSLCHSVEANNFIEEVCEELSLNFFKAYKYENPVWEIEQKINEADLIIGLGRSAYEAMSCGRPVLIYDSRRYFESYGDGYIRNKLGFSLKNNCSGRYFKIIFDKNKLKKELAKYSSLDSTYFREFSEKELDVKKNIKKYINYYHSLVENRKEAKRIKKIKLAKRLIGNKTFNSLAKVYKRFRCVN